MEWVPWLQPPPAWDRECGEDGRLKEEGEADNREINVASAFCILPNKSCINLINGVSWLAAELIASLEATDMTQSGLMANLEDISPLTNHEAMVIPKHHKILKHRLMYHMGQSEDDQREQHCTINQHRGNFVDHQSHQRIARH